jgi:hypothetical protein
MDQSRFYTNIEVRGRFLDMPHFGQLFLDNIAMSMGWPCLREDSAYTGIRDVACQEGHDGTAKRKSYLWCCPRLVDVHM